MAFKFNEEVAKNVSDNYEPLPVGDYNVRIKEATLTVSSTGKEMVKLKLECFENNNHVVWDNLVLIENADWVQQKILRIYDCFGLPHQDVTVETLPMWIGKVGRISLGIEKDNNNNDKNVVKRWLKKEEQSKSAVTDNDLPF